MAENHVLLETIHLTQSAASVTFNNIPQTGYTDLKIVLSGRTDRNNSDPAADLGIRLNGITSGYTFKGLNGDGSGANSFTGSNQGNYSGLLIQSAYSTANTFGNGEIYIPNAFGSQSKTLHGDTVTEHGATTTFIRSLDGTSTITNPVTSIVLYESNGYNFVAGSTFSIYGIAKFGLSPEIAPFADGGNIIANDGTYWYHAFVNSGTFTPKKSLTCDLLIIAGGGSGTYGSYAGAGGGAGGYLELSGQSLTSTDYAIGVGAGGAAATRPMARGNNGTNSTFGTLTAAVGGGGAGGSGTAAANNGYAGGSGGGGATNDNTGGAYTYGGAGTDGQGYAGGGNGGYPNPPYPSGGGGGAGAVGQTAPNSTTAGNGGVGKYTTLSDLMGAATLLGHSSGGHYYFAGGGGGACHNGGTSGSGGTGGGGAGGYYNSTAGTSGTANTGGGGGSGTNNTVPGAGGSGVVIIRYPMAS